MASIDIQLKPQDLQELLKTDPVSKLTPLAFEQLKNIALSRMLMEAQTLNGAEGDLEATEEEVGASQGKT